MGEPHHAAAGWEPAALVSWLSYVPCLRDESLRMWRFDECHRVTLCVIVVYLKLDFANPIKPGHAGHGRAVWSNVAWLLAQPTEVALCQEEGVCV